ncbi:MAG TPA: GNA1162 family protein [Candidatus Binataceae bacterium]|nr:GNA1162 family protein [Candidatus Binataceae bacterium]
MKPTSFLKESFRHMRPICLAVAAAMVLISGCAASTPRYQTRPFFLDEEDTATHGRKSWFDRIIETDPGVTDYVVATDYQEQPPRRIAVLPFVDHGDGEYTVDKIPLSWRKSEEQLNRSAWTHANRVRRSVSGEIGGREFQIVPLVAVDAVLADRGIDNWNKLLAVKPEQLGHWLDADAIVYGEILDYEAYYAGLISVWRVTAAVRIVSTRDGHEFFTADSHRYSVDLSPAIDPIDIGINSVETLIDLRDLRLARAEYEVGREIVMRLPTARLNIAQLQKSAVEKERGLEEEGAVKGTAQQMAQFGREVPNSR